MPSGNDRAVDPEREHLRELSVRLLGLHGLLLERERRRYEAAHGPVAPAALLRLALHDAQFAWLRALSGLIARVDERLYAAEGRPREAADTLLGDAYRLLKSGRPGVFEEKYREALQDSPDLVLAHAGLTDLLPRPGAPPEPGPHRP
jgi:hypothetical protein